MKSYCKREDKWTINLSENKSNCKTNKSGVQNYNVICKCGYLKTVYEKNGFILLTSFNPDYDFDNA